MLYTKYISRNKQKKQNKTWYFTIMNAPEMVLQGKSWRNREQPPPEINSGHATSVRRNWPWSSAVDQGVRIPVTNDFGLPESRVQRSDRSGHGWPGAVHHLEARPLAHAQSTAPCGPGRRSTTGFGLSTVFSSHTWRARGRRAAAPRLCLEHWRRLQGRLGFA